MRSNAPVSKKIDFAQSPSSSTTESDDDGVGISTVVCLRKSLRKEAKPVRPVSESHVSANVSSHVSDEAVT